MASSKVPDQKFLTLPGRARWRAWLKQNHKRSGGVWVLIAKKHADGLHYEEAVEEALCFGWIDSTVNRLDDNYYKQWYSPRKARSTWSKSNKQRVERLTRQGRMAKAGLAIIREAKRNGSWVYLDSVENIEEPAALKKALAANKKAKANYEKLSPSLKKQHLYWIKSARQQETRARRIRETVERLERNIKPGM